MDKSDNSLFTKVKDHIATVLMKRSPDQDVFVRVGSVSYGLWIWDEATGVHIHMSPSSINKALGLKKLDFPEIALAWNEINSISL